MKHLNILSIGLLLSFFFTSCGDESNNYTKLDEKNFVESVFTAEYTQKWRVTDDNLNEKVGTWSWTEAEFGIEAPVTYDVYIDVDENFTNAEKVATYNSFGKEEVMTMKDLNAAVQKFLPEGIEKGDEVETKYYFYLRSYLGSTGAISAFKSKTFEITFTPMFNYVPITELYMIGAEFGNWNWSDKGVVSMTPVGGGKEQEEHFWCIRYIKAKNDKDEKLGFKWALGKDWDKFASFEKLETSEGFTTDGGNAFVEKDGLYMIYVNYADKLIKIEPAQVFGTGDAFSGTWGDKKHPFTINGDKMSITVLENKDLRMYAATSAKSGDWWTREFQIFNGKIDYRGAGGDQNAVPVTAGQVVTLDFNNGTGTIK